MKTILKKIKKYETIIIHRHTNPDLDAYGSQLGLAYTLKHNFPNKEIYVVGDENHFSWMGKMDKIDDIKYVDALVIIVDVALSYLTSDQRFKQCKELVVIDHHTNTTDLNAYTLIDSTYGAAAQLIADFIYKSNLVMCSEAATMLFAGIIADTGRFQYTKNDSKVMFTAAKLLQSGANSEYVYENMYQESLESKQTKAYFSSNFSLTKNNVAYLKNDVSIYDKFDLKPFSISRGMVNVMAGIKEVPIWCNFTYNPEDNKIMCEFRSKKIIIVDIAKKYGGGGHNLACGATVENFEVCDLILADFDKLVCDYNMCK